MFDHEVKQPKSRLPMIIGAVSLLAVVLGLGLIPMSRTVPGSCTLAPASTAELKAPHPGTFASVAVSENAAVEAGQVLATWDTAEAEERVKTLEPRLPELDAQLEALDTPAKQRLVAVVDKAEAAAATAREALVKAQEGDDDAKTPAALAAGKRVASAEAVLAQARAAAGPSRAELEGERAKATHDLEQAREVIAHPTLLSPAAGVVSALKARAGEPIAADEALLRLDVIDKLQATVMTNEESLQKGMGAELTIGQVKQHVTLDSGGVATVDNAKHELKPGMDCTAAIAGTPHPFLHL